MTSSFLGGILKLNKLLKCDFFPPHPSCDYNHAEPPKMQPVKLQRLQRENCVIYHLRGRLCNQTYGALSLRLGRIQFRILQSFALFVVGSPLPQRFRRTKQAYPKQQGKPLPRLFLLTTCQEPKITVRTSQEGWGRFDDCTEDPSKKCQLQNSSFYSSWSLHSLMQGRLASYPYIEVATCDLFSTASSYLPFWSTSVESRLVFLSMHNG